MSEEQVSENKNILDQIANSILKDINFTKSIDQKILEEQERTWLYFGACIPLHIKKQVPPIIKEQTNIRVRWIKKDILVIEFFAEDELSEIRHRKSSIQRQIQNETSSEPRIEEWKVQTLRKKKRETIPMPSSEVHYNPHNYFSK